MVVKTGHRGEAGRGREGNLIIPMDTTYQPLGLFKAFGLINQLLLANVPVHWAIKPGKIVGDPGDADFVASAVDVQSGEAVTSHGYRGGPFLVEAANAATASAVVAEWQAGNVTVVHRATATFDAPVARTLTAAPTIGVFADGNESIAFGYLNAAGILDRNGQPWPGGKLGDYGAYPEVLTAVECRTPVSRVLPLPGESPEGPGSELGFQRWPTQSKLIRSRSMTNGRLRTWV